LLLGLVERLQNCLLWGVSLIRAKVCLARNIVLNFCSCLKHHEILRCWVASVFTFKFIPDNVLMGNHRAWILVHAKGAFFWAWQIWMWLAK
jgi:hypothetical protein